MTKKIISVVRKNANGQRRVNVPKKDETLEDGDLVELKKVEIKWMKKRLIKY